MRRDVPLRHDRVTGLRKHIARGPHEQRSERHIAGGTRLRRELDGSAQVRSSASVIALLRRVVAAPARAPLVDSTVIGGRLTYGRAEAPYSDRPMSARASARSG
jgi:hypothetical protein